MLSGFQWFKKGEFLRVPGGVVLRAPEGPFLRCSGCVRGSAGVLWESYFCCLGFFWDQNRTFKDQQKG